MKFPRFSRQLRNWCGLRWVRLRGRKEGYRVFLVLFLVLLVAWLLGFLVFHVAGVLIHLLIIVGLICLIVHFVRRGTA